MADHEVEGVLGEVRELLRRGSDTDGQLGGMLRRAAVISDRISAMKEFQHDLQQLRAANNSNERRHALLSELQHENRMIMSYQEENHMLKDALEKSYATLDEIMHRHRTLMTRVQADPSLAAFSPALLEELLARPIHCRALTSEHWLNFYRRVAEVMVYCEKLAAADTRRYAQLAKENSVLRELLNCARLSDPTVAIQFRLLMEAYNRAEEKEERKKNAEEEEQEPQDCADENLNGSVSTEEDINLNVTVLDRRLLLEEKKKKSNGVGQNGPSPSKPLHTEEPQPEEVLSPSKKINGNSAVPDMILAALEPNEKERKESPTKSPSIMNGGDSPTREEEEESDAESDVTVIERKKA